MLNLSKTRVVDAVEVPLYSLAAAIEEGMGLIKVMEGGLGKATITGSPSNSHEFMGIAKTYFTTPATAVMVELITVPASSPYTVVLKQTPTADAAVMVRNSSDVAYTQGSVADGVYAISGSTLTFHSANAGLKLTATYRYNLSVLQAQALVGDGVPGNVVAANVTGNIGCIRKGEVYTSFFDTSVNWTTATAAKVGANGLIIATGGTGAAISPVRILEVPTVDSPFLGLYINV